jgi:plasmid stabilization system protein ParE
MCASPDEFAGPLGYIVSAILIPLGELAGRDRELSHDRPYRYLIFYELDDDAVVILNVRHPARRHPRSDRS